MSQAAIRILDPRAFPVEAVGRAPALASLDGVVVAMLWNNRPRGDRLLQGVASALERTYGARTVFRQKLRVGTGAPPEVIAQVTAEAAAAVVGVGD